MIRNAVFCYTDVYQVYWPNVDGQNPAPLEMAKTL